LQQLHSLSWSIFFPRPVIAILKPGLESGALDAALDRFPEFLFPETTIHTSEL
jgi:hypothetical protein